MNESLFACYDSLFCAGSTQLSDLQHNPTQQQIVEHDLQPNTLYFSGSTEVPMQQLKQQQLYASVSAPAVAPNHQSIAGRDEANLISNTTTFSNAHNIPFVQIHTTDVQPQRSNYGNVFRRAVTSSHAEIKSEPIKSETADSSKERLNATPTPPVKNTNSNTGENEATPSSPRNESSLQTTDTMGSESVSQLVSSSRITMLNLDIGYHSVRKCKQCRFICLDDINLEKHMISVHSSSFNGESNETTGKQIPCPGCSNVFFAHKSLEVHLIQDHFTTESDAKKFIEAVGSTIYDRSKISTSSTDESPSQERKSRIYLKNVECLREPRREPLEMDGIHHSHIPDGFYQTNSFNNLERHMDLSAILNSDFSDMCSQGNGADKQLSNQANSSTTEGAHLGNRPKQKISIKSVDVLREPALLRRDYDMQNQFCTLSNNCNELNFDSFNGFQQSSANVGSSENDVLCPVSNDDEVEMLNGSSLDKPRRPKIYIKNVDILKEPIMLPTISMPDTHSGLNYNFLAQSIQQAASNSDFMNNPNSLGVTNQVYDSENIGQLAIGGSGSGSSSGIPDTFLYDNVTNANNHVNNISNSGNGLLTDISGVSGADVFQSFGNNNGTINTSFLTYPSISCTSVDSSSHVQSTTPIITEPTPPPAPVFAMQGFEEICNIMETIPATTTPKQKQKIFIKNVDILKEPQFQEQRERGTLHLRTVDELNLMNRNEVESLIAPNLENNNVNSGCSFPAHLEDHTQIPEEEDTPEHDIFYEENSLKFTDYASQLVNSWPGDDYDLGDDIDCIITDSIEPINNVQATLPPLSPNGANTTSFQKIIHDLETPQMSMISIRDIEELTGPQHSQQQAANVGSNLNALDVNNPNHAHRMLVPLDSHALQHDNVGNRRSFGIVDIMEDEAQKTGISVTLPEDQEKTRSSRKHDRAKNIISLPIATSTSISNTASVSLSTSFNFNMSVSLPPLAPVTNFVHSDKVVSKETTANSSTPVASSIPIPSLVPVPSLVPFTVSSSTFKSAQTTNVSTSSTSNTTTLSNSTPVERGRIYVANNLMQVPSPKKDVNTSLARKSASLSVTGGTSVRGRPFGSNRSDNSNKTRSETEEVVLKCSVRGCAFRFKKPDTLAYHKRCHNGNSSNSQAKLCPECQLKDFGNWNTLHTHLWRSHQIDMELYCCSQCPFKTPIYSRLVNTHAKIHSEERNYKCEQCGKAFKNTKQLKNHRRWHRTHGSAVSPSKAETPSLTSKDLHRCTNCSAAFSHLKTLREHCCKNSKNQILCSVCGHIASSRSSLKLHMFTHENTKRLKCTSCTYSTSDHNAFRRHKMTHENTKMYVCPICSYKSIQSVTFQKHVIMKHPDTAPTLIHKCKICSYSTVNRTLFALHQIRHKSIGPEDSSNNPKQRNSSIKVIEDKIVNVKNTKSDCDPLKPSQKRSLNNYTKNNNNNCSDDDV